MKSKNGVVDFSMKQEHRLVAETYRFLAPFINAKKDIYLSLDGQAAKTAAAKGRFLDQSIPDLWFTLIGDSKPLRLEAKILDKGRVLLMLSQIQAWHSTGSGSHKPDAWIAANRDFDEFYFWTHQQLLKLLDGVADAKRQREITAPKEKLVFKSPAALALHVLRLRGATPTARR